jgi:hypothetical protein
MFILGFNLVLRLKNFNLVPYVYFRFQFGHFRQFCPMWQTVCIRGLTRGHVDTCPIETVNLAEGTN